MKLTWSYLFVKGNIGPLVQLKYKRDINIKRQMDTPCSLLTVYFLFSVFTVTQKTQNKPKTSPQYDCSPDRVSTAIRCHKATGSQCASVAGTSLGTNNNKKHGMFCRLMIFIHTAAQKKKTQLLVTEKRQLRWNSFTVRWMLMSNTGSETQVKRAAVAFHQHKYD